MNLCDTVRSFAPKITPGYRETRYCSFAAPEETIGVIDLSPTGDGSRGIAFLTDRLLVKLGGDIRQLYYSDIRVIEILPSYETPFEDELLLNSPSHEIRISDCALNKFFLRQLISNIARISVAMNDSDREALYSQLTSEALDYYTDGSAQKNPQPEQPQQEYTEPLRQTFTAVQEIAAAKKAALAQYGSSTEITDDGISWLSGKQPEIPRQEGAPSQTEKLPETIPDITADEDITDMTREQAISYLLDSIAEINSEPQPEITPEAPEAQPLLPENTIDNAPELPAAEQPVSPSPYTTEPDSPDIYIQASRRIRELCEDGKLTMEQVNATVREQLVPASELFSTLDIESAPLPSAVKAHALRLSEAADRLPEYFRLGEDIAARVMFFMLYQMLSYTDRIVQSDETKQRLNYFFVRFGAAGMILSMLDANG